MRTNLLLSISVIGILIGWASPVFSQAVAINDNGSAPAASAILDVNFFGVSKKGVLVPRMTTAQRIAIVAPATSLLVFDSNTNSFWYYGGAGPGWIEFIANSNNLWAKTGNDIYNTNTANVGVGTATSIKAKFHVSQNSSVVFGPDSNTLSNSRFWFSGTKNALRIGTYADVPFGAGSWDYANIGVNSLGIGTNNKITGNGSVGIGDYNQTYGEGSAALGWLNISTGRGSFTTGYLNTADQAWGQAIGYNNTTHGTWGFTGGYGSFSWGDASFAFGTQISSNSINMTTFGAYNDTSQYANANKNSWINSDPLFVIGNGASSLAKSNAIILLKDGRFGIGNEKPDAALHVGPDKTVIFGNDSLSSTLGNKFVWFGTKSAIRFGQINFAGSTSWDYANIGVNSIAIGEGAKASGPQSFSQGYYSNATGYYSIARGFAANANGDHSTAMGQALSADGVGAVAFGDNNYVAGNWGFSHGYNNVVTGVFATAIGQGLSARAYNSFVIGRFNDSIGTSTTTSWVATDPLLIIGNGTGFSARANAVTVLKNGSFGISNNSPNSLLHVGVTTGARISLGSVETLEDLGSNTFGFNSNLYPTLDGVYTLGGPSNRWLTVYATNGVINTSDARDKKNIAKIRYGLSDLMKLNPVSFDWNNDQSGDGSKLGLIAQEVLNVIPEVVKKEENVIVDETTGQLQRKAVARYGIYYSDLIPVLIKSIQEQQTVISDQKQKIDDLEKRLQAIEARLK